VQRCSTAVRLKRSRTSGSRKEVLSVANKFIRRRTVVLLALVVISVIAGKVGHPGLGLGHGGFGMWDGPLP